MISCIVAGMDKNIHEQINYDKIKEVTQDLDENPTLFLNHLNEAMIKYTNLNPASQEGRIFLHLHFISQSAPDIQKMLQKLEKDLQTPLKALTNMAFKFFNNRDEEAKQLRNKNSLIYQMLASILQNQMPHTDPKDLANSPLRPTSNVETQDIGQNLPLIHVH
jgi:hypothetical protein